MSEPVAPLAPLAIVVAAAENGAIGKDGKLPWHIPEDLRHFKNVTMGHTVIMGRKTYDSIGKVLPGRRFVVVTRKADLKIDGCDVVTSFEDALAVARQTDPEPRVIGGAELYALAFPLATKIYLTEIHREVDADAFIRLDRTGFRETERRAAEAADVEFVTLERG